MPQGKAALLLLAFISVCLSPCTLAAAAAEGGGKPLVTAVSKDPATLLYTSPLKDSRALVLDLAAPLIWTVTTDGHTRTTTTLSANATDGKNPLYPVSFSAVTSCAPRSLLAKIPAGAVGVAGLGSSRLSLPGQVARTQKVPNKFLLCLPRSGGTDGDGVAIFGGGPLFTLKSVASPELGPDLTMDLTRTSLVARKHSSAYALPVKAFAVGGARLRLPGGGVVFSTKAPYTALRPDVYRPFVHALDAASGWRGFKVPAVAPFELCYNSSFLPNTRIGHLPPSIDLMLQDGQNYTIAGLDSMIDLDNFRTACFAFVEMKAPSAGAPAMEIGGFQMENNVLQFDLENMQLGFARVPIFTACSNFNFTQPAH
jgi:hypothetical protein